MCVSPPDLSYLIAVSEDNAKVIELANIPPRVLEDSAWSRMAPSDVCLFSDDGFGTVELIISQYSMQCISKLKVANGSFVNFEILAGKPSAVGDKVGSPQDARFNQPITCTLDRNGDILISDCYNHSIKKYDVKTRKVVPVTGMLLTTR